MSANNAIEYHLENAFTKPSSRNAQGRKLSAYIRQIKTTQSIVNSNGHDRSIVDVKSAFFDTLLQDAAQDAQFTHIETSSCMLKLDDIAKELCLERAITDHRITHLVKTT